MEAIGFVHGREWWPQHKSVRDGFYTVEEKIRAHSEIPVSRYRLLGETACANGADLHLALECATRFFLRNDTLSELVTHLLYLSRQSTQRVVPIDVGTLSLCAVFEGLVMKVFGQSSSPDDSGAVRAFNAAKEDLIAYAKSREKSGNDAFSRLAGRIGGATPYRLKDALQWLGTHLGLKWDPELKDTFAVWSAERNLLAHGSAMDADMDRLLKQSRLPAAST